uniref:Zinc finger protein 436-like n=1 Tax=Oryzias melastigma TaxID=30732 RepID=A0A3B3DBH7_ORYME
MDTTPLLCRRTTSPGFFAAARASSETDVRLSVAGSSGAQRKEPTGVDKRFLSMRPVNKNFSEEETKCQLCEKVFEHPNHSLNQHKRLHAGPTNLCNICGKNFSKNGFVRHMQMHKGEKNYLCTTCGKSFFSSGELHMHDRTHTGETPYTCIHCGKGFSCKGHLTVHLRSHTGERPYACLDCPKRFLTVNCLKRHALKNNKIRFLKPK